MILRLGAADVETFLDLPDVTPFIAMGGRRMKQWIVVPPAMLKYPAGAEDMARPGSRLDMLDWAWPTGRCRCVSS
jgi:hypothetical protein